jgi:hypothetical protein
MSTPNYLGAAQPTGNSGGFLGRLSSYFGGSGTPAYAAVGQPAAALGGSTATPTYAPAPVQSTDGTPKFTCVCMRNEEPPATQCPLDPDALAAGQIAIVIPHQGT